MPRAQLMPAVESFLSAAGFEVERVRLSQVNGGGNNRVFAVDDGRQKYLVKVYFNNPKDIRDRLGAEYSFLSYAVKIGVECVPRPIYSCPGKNMGLYEFIEGKKLAASELSRQHIIEAAHFIRDINVGRNRDGILPTASEGCFSIGDHCELIDNRIKRLKGMPIDFSIDRRASSLVDGIEDAWEKIKQRINAESSLLSTSLNDKDRCISPSDFGFHNALLRKSGDVCFIDFEYAGWDDPAKMIDDFFLQPMVRVSSKYFDLFVDEALSYSPNLDKLKARARLLFPIFQIKWCCIMLNIFLPDAAKRRRFAMPVGDAKLMKQQQLAKAEFLLGKTGLI